MARVELPGGVPAWCATGQEVIKRLLTDPRVSKDAYRHWPAWIDGRVTPQWSLAIWVSVQNMFTSYGEEHARLRKPVTREFTARRVSALMPRVERITETLLDRLEELSAGGGVVDLRTEFAEPLPHRVVCELFGIPERYQDELHEIVKGFFRTGASMAEAQANAQALYATMTDFVSFKRRSPGDDLTGSLMTAFAEGATPLSEKEVIDNLIMLFTAGYEPTVNLLDNAVTALLTHPEQLDLIRSGRAGWDDAVEETLRAEAPGAVSLLRYALEDIPVGDTVIPRGDAIVVSFAAAGRDPEVHGEDADRFDVTRPGRRGHLSFGYGVHHCPGAPLARRTAATVLPALFARFPDLALAEPAARLRPLGSFIANGHRELPVVLGKRAEG
ncbi:cytochrome P450 [Streptomyces sp. NPDC047928]|uniref:cytochrome P450 family protein n=1 Tax=unclassified Streptomyces TaxID=2593676 RepID=UPI003714CAB5